MPGCCNSSQARLRCVCRKTWRCDSSPRHYNKYMKNKSPYILKIDSDISLRVRTKDEALELFNLVQENKKHLSKFLVWVEYTKSVSDSKDFIVKKLKEFTDGKSCDFGIYFKEEIIGSAGLIKIDKENKTGEIGYWISKNYEGRGIVTNVVKKLIEISKKKYKLHRIEIQMLTENKKSRAVPERLGFTHEGTMKDVVIRKGKFHSKEVWGLII